MPHETDRPQPAEGLTPEELAAETASELPEREALSIVDPGVFSTLPTAPLGRAEADTSGATSDTPPDLGPS